MTLTITCRESPKEVVMRSNRIKMAAAGVVTAGSLVAGVGVAQAAVPSLSNSNTGVVHLPVFSGPSITAEVQSDGGVLVQGTGFTANHQVTVGLQGLDQGTRTIGEYPTTGSNGDFVTEFPTTFIGGCFPSGASVYAIDSGNVHSNTVSVPGAGCAVPPPPSGGGGGGTPGWNDTPHPPVHYQ
jgi:hypothetical protein